MKAGEVPSPHPHELAAKQSIDIGVVGSSPTGCTGDHDILKRLSALGRKLGKIGLGEHGAVSRRAKLRRLVWVGAFSVGIGIKTTLAVPKLRKILGTEFLSYTNNVLVRFSTA
jgi:hypothetical protein